MHKSLLERPLLSIEHVVVYCILVLRPRRSLGLLKQSMLKVLDCDYGCFKLIGNDRQAYMRPGAAEVAVMCSLDHALPKQ